MARNNKPYDARATAIDIGVHLNDEQIRRLQEIARDYDASDWRMWTKNRLSEWGLLRAHCQGCEAIELFVVLHVFNIYRADVLPSTGRFLFSPEVARSKVIRGVVVPTPVDRTAWRVAPDAKRKKIAQERQWMRLD